MSANDQVQGGAPFDENEDLFDFPVIEMTLEGLIERTPGVGASTRVSLTPPMPVPAPALPKPPTVAPKATTLGNVAPTPAAEPKPTAAAARATAPAAASGARAPAAAATARPAPTAPPARAPVAPLVDSAAPVDVDGETPADASPSRPRLTRMRGLRLALIMLLGLNATGFWFLWRTHTSFESGLDTVRAEIDGAAMRLERARRETMERGSASFSGEGPSLEALDALERTALDLAVNEIRAGDYGAARRRLSRLLVRAERMAPGLRAEVEPRAAYLIARSYHEEAQARQGAQR